MQLSLPTWNSYTFISTRRYRGRAPCIRLKLTRKYLRSPLVEKRSKRDSKPLHTTYILYTSCFPHRGNDSGYSSEAISAMAARSLLLAFIGPHNAIESLRST